MQEEVLFFLVFYFDTHCYFSLSSSFHTSCFSSLPSKVAFFGAIMWVCPDISHLFSTFLIALSFSCFMMILPRYSISIGSTPTKWFGTRYSFVMPLFVELSIMYHLFIDFFSPVSINRYRYLNTLTLLLRGLMEKISQHRTLARYRRHSLFLYHFSLINIFHLFLMQCIRTKIFFRI